jgi:hypothetical protein
MWIVDEGYLSFILAGLGSHRTQRFWSFLAAPFPSLSLQQVPGFFVELMRMHQDMPELVHRIGLALCNIVLSDPKSVKPVMNDIDVVTIAVDLMAEFPEQVRQCTRDRTLALFDL